MFATTHGRKLRSGFGKKRERTGPHPGTWSKRQIARNPKMGPVPLGLARYYSNGDQIKHKEHTLCALAVGLPVGH